MRGRDISPYLMDKTRHVPWFFKTLVFSALLVPITLVPITPQAGRFRVLWQFSF